jgi:hypothetical protein
MIFRNVPSNGGKDKYLPLRILGESDGFEIVRFILWLMDLAKEKINQRGVLKIQLVSF